MISLLCGSFGDWLSDMGNIILFGVIAVFVAIVMFIMARHKGSRSILLVILSGVIIVSGVYCGIASYKEITSESYINGSLDVTNDFVVDTYEYNVSSLSLYNDIYSDKPNLYTNSVETAKVDNFNANTKKYTVIFNDYELLEQVVYSAGAVYFELEYEFKDTSNNVLCIPKLCVSVRFLSNKTVLNVSCLGNAEAQYIQQYFSDYGFRLQIKEIKNGL